MTTVTTAAAFLLDTLRGGRKQQPNVNVVEMNNALRRKGTKNPNIIPQNFRTEIVHTSGTFFDLFRTIVFFCFNHVPI